jgi:hypothetical protein
MWLVNCKVTSSLLDEMETPLSTWPTVYSAMDVIANRATEPHCDQGGAASFYDHLIGFGQNHDACFHLDDLEGQFAYSPGTSILFSGKGLSHSVPEWSGGERMVIAHYTKDMIHDRLGLARPVLPTQSSWWSKYS